MKDLSKIKLIVSDFDGTLLNWEKKCITDRTVKIINNLSKRNKLFVIATARPWYALKPYIKKIQRSVEFFILCNGAWIKKNNGEDLFLNFISKNAILRIVKKWWDNKDVRFMLISKNETFINRFSPHKYIRNYQIMLNSKIISKEKVSQNAEKIFNIEVDASLSLLKMITKDLNKNEVTFTFSWPEFLEIYSKKISKGKALERLCKYLNVKKEEILAFGDGNNDLELLKKAGFGVAMANSTSEMKNNADYVTSNCNEDGVAFFIENFIC